MNLDGATIGLWGLIFAGMSVVATFVAPRLVGGARLKFELKGPSPLRHREQVGSLRISIFQDGEEVVGNVYLVEGVLTSCGSRDISYQDFVDPVRFSSGPGMDILSAEAFSSEGIGGNIAVVDGVVLLKWRILKPKEFIKIRFVVKSARLIERANGLRIINEEIRLKDVKSEEGLFSKYKVPRLMMVFSLLLTTIVFINFIPSKSTSIIYDSEGVSYRLRLSPLGNAVCEIENNMFYVNKCRSVSAVEVSNILPDSRIGEVFSGIRPIWFIFAVSISFMYSLILVYGLGFVDKVLSRLGWMPSR